MIQPGETARSHRHTPAALRLVLDAANDVYTVVDGKRVDMTPGEVVLTPSWCWHGHANRRKSPSMPEGSDGVPLILREVPSKGG